MPILASVWAPRPGSLSGGGHLVLVILPRCSWSQALGFCSQRSELSSRFCLPDVRCWCTARTFLPPASSSPSTTRHAPLCSEPSAGKTSSCPGAVTQPDPWSGSCRLTGHPAGMYQALACASCASTQPLLPC